MAAITGFTRSSEGDVTGANLSLFISCVTAGKRYWQIFFEFLADLGTFLGVRAVRLSGVVRLSMAGGGLNCKHGREFSFVNADSRQDLLPDLDKKCTCSNAMYLSGIVFVSTFPQEILVTSSLVFFSMPDSRLASLTNRIPRMAIVGR